ncbi:hypothetical protein R4K48_13630 [Brachyspira pulli]|uniref:hypothetical protein n=1 Tax=Brachyspira pulli TaxID=310721 RepID=UPI003003CDCB
MKFNFVLPYTDKLEEDDEKAIENYVINIINKSENNNNKLAILILEASSCLSSAEARINHIYTDGFLSNISHSINGYTEKIKRNRNYNILVAQKASLKILEILAEQNKLNFQAITSINNKINNIHIELKKEFKRIYDEIKYIYEHSLEKIKNNVALLQLSQNIEIFTYNNIYYKDLDRMAKIVCIVNDFYHTSKNSYSELDFITLRSIIDDLELDLHSTIKTIDFYEYILKNPNIIDRLYENIIFDNIDNIISWSVAISSGIRKLISFSENENYILQSISKLSDKKEDEIKIVLVEEYLKNTADFDINKNIKIDEFIIMLINDLSIIDSYSKRIYEDLCTDNLIIDTKKNEIKEDEIKEKNNVPLEELFEKNRLYELIYECNTIIQLKNVRDDAEVIKAHKYRADSFIKLENSILEEFNSLIESFPNNIELYLYKSKYLFNKNKYLSSISVLDDCIEKCGKTFILLLEKIKIKDFLLTKRMELVANFFEENLLEILDKKYERDIEETEDNPILKSAVSFFNEISNTIIGTEMSRRMDALSDKRDLEKVVKDFIKEINEAKNFDSENCFISYTLLKYQYIALSLEYGYISTLTDFKKLKKIEKIYYSIGNINNYKYKGNNIKDKHKSSLLDMSKKLESIFEKNPENEYILLLLALIYKINSLQDKLLKIKKQCLKNKLVSEYCDVLFE